MVQGHIAAIRYYPYSGITDAIDDLEAGSIGLIIKLFPVISWLVRDRAELRVALQVATGEKLGIAFAKGRTDLCTAVEGAIRTLRGKGIFARLEAQWLAPQPGA